MPFKPNPNTSFRRCPRSLSEDEMKEEMLQIPSLRDEILSNTRLRYPHTSKYTKGQPKDRPENNR